MEGGVWEQGYAHTYTASVAQSVEHRPRNLVVTFLNPVRGSSSNRYFVQELSGLVDYTSFQIARINRHDAHVQCIYVHTSWQLTTFIGSVRIVALPKKLLSLVLCPNPLLSDHSVHREVHGLIRFI